MAVDRLIPDRSVLYGQLFSWDNNWFYNFSWIAAHTFWELTSYQRCEQVLYCSAWLENMCLWLWNSASAFISKLHIGPSWSFMCDLERQTQYAVQQIMNVKKLVKTDEWRDSKRKAYCDARSEDLEDLIRAMHWEHIVQLWKRKLPLLWICRQ